MKKKYIETKSVKAPYALGRFYSCDYFTRLDCISLVSVNHTWIVYYRKKFKQNSNSQLDKAVEVIKDDLHTIIDAICDFYA